MCSFFFHLYSGDSNFNIISPFNLPDTPCGWCLEHSRFMVIGFQIPPAMPLIDSLRDLEGLQLLFPPGSSSNEISRANLTTILINNTGLWYTIGCGSLQKVK